MGLYEMGFYHSNISIKNIVIEYNQKNGRLEINLIDY